VAYSSKSIETENRHRIAYEFIACEPDDIRRLLRQSVEKTGLRHFRCISLDLNSLADLYCDLKGIQYNEAVLKQFRVLRRSQDFKTTLISPPDDFCRIFSTPHAMDYAGAWTEKTGILLSKWQSEYKHKVVENLMQLANYALANQLSVYVKVRVT
jgi:hypothetical protein